MDSDSNEVTELESKSERPAELTTWLFEAFDAVDILSELEEEELSLKDEISDCGLDF